MNTNGVSFAGRLFIISIMMPIPIFKDRYLRNSLAISFLIIIIAFGIAYFSLKDVDYSLVFHFTGGRGIDFLGTVKDIWSVLFSSLVVLGVNLFLINIFYQRLNFLSYLISFFNIFFSTLILIAVAVIISVN